MSRPLLVLSSLAVIGVLRATASAAPTATTQRDRLPTLAVEATTQFELAFRACPSKGEARREKLEAVVATWRAAPRTEANDEQLSNWIHAAIRASMPGSPDELPTPPTFAGITSRATTQPAKSVVSARTPEPTLAMPSTAHSKSSGQTDPFRDDPADMKGSR
jgi:hypothetical protein